MFVDFGGLHIKRSKGWNVSLEAGVSRPVYFDHGVS